MLRGSRAGITFAANYNSRDMYSSADLERFYFQHKTETLLHGESLQSFCVKNAVPYNLFHKWYKDTRNKIVSVQVDGIPCDEEMDDISPTVDSLKSSDSTDKPSLS